MLETLWQSDKERSKGTNKKLQIEIMFLIIRILCKTLYICETREHGGFARKIILPTLTEEESENLSRPTTLNQWEL